MKSIDSMTASTDTPTADPKVFVVDGDVSSRRSLEALIRSVGCDVKIIAAPAELVAPTFVALPDPAEIHTLRSRYETLSAREREVMGLVACGLLNKQVGAELGISVITVKQHRGKLMRKMRARSLADLVMMAAHLRPPVPLPRTRQGEAILPPCRSAQANLPAIQIA